MPAPNSGFIAISAGSDHALGLKANGSVVGWGENSSGQCTVPAPNSGFIAVAACKGAYSLGLKTNGSIVRWGAASTPLDALPTPNEGFIAIDGMYYTGLAIRFDGHNAAGAEWCLYP